VGGKSSDLFYYQQLIGIFFKSCIFNNSSASYFLSLISLFIFNNLSESTFIFDIFAGARFGSIFIDNLATCHT